MSGRKGDFIWFTGSSGNVVDAHTEELGKKLETNHSYQMRNLLPFHSLVVYVKCEYGHSRGKRDNEYGGSIINTCKNHSLKN